MFTGLGTNHIIKFSSVGMVYVEGGSKTQNSTKAQNRGLYSALLYYSAFLSNVNPFQQISNLVISLAPKPVNPHPRTRPNPELSAIYSNLEPALASGVYTFVRLSIKCFWRTNIAS